MSKIALNTIAREVFLWFSNLMLGFSGFACLAFGVVSLWRNGDLAATSAGLTAGLVLLLASSIERFEVLKGMGIEARTRRLDEAITQANATLEQIRELAELSGESVVSLNSRTGRWDSALAPRESYGIVQRVRSNLQNLGCSESSIKSIMAPWVQVTTLDRVRVLLTQLRKPLLIDQQELDLKIRAYPTPIALGDANYQMLLDERNRLGRFEGECLGDVSSLPVGTHARRLRRFVESMPLLHEDERPRLLKILAPWEPRLEYLATHYDLSDQEEWFTADAIGLE